MLHAAQTVGSTRYDYTVTHVTIVCDHDVTFTSFVCVSEMNKGLCSRDLCTLEIDYTNILYKNRLSNHGAIVNTSGVLLVYF